MKAGDSMSYDGTVRTSEVFVPLTEKYILMTYFRRDMSLSTRSKHSHLENKGPLNQRLLQRERSSKAFTILSSMLALALTLAPTVLPAEAADNDIDQGGGTHFLQFGVFLTPLKGRNPHTVRFQGVLDGVALLANNSGHPFTEDITYNVQVIPSGLEK